MSFSNLMICRLTAALCMLIAIHAIALADENLMQVHLNLSKQDLIDSKRAERLGFTDWGQFEILVAKRAIHVDAPKYRQSIILRMPGTIPGSSKAANDVAEKKVLYEKFQQLKKDEIQNLPITINLRPYVKINKNTQLPELTECNAFFTLDKFNAPS